VHSFLDWSEGIQKKEGKFFAYLHLLGPHIPYAAPARCRKQLGLKKVPRLLPPSYGGFTSFKEQPSLEADELRELIGNYDAALLHRDELVKLLVDRLKDSGLYEDSLLIITSDHGEEFYEHGGWYHGTSLFEEQVRVPLLIVSPGRIDKGRRVSDLISHIDIMPLLLALCDGERSPSFEIETLLSEIRKRRSLGHDSVFFELPGKNIWARAIRENQYKLIYGYHEGKEKKLLFDLEADPLERDNLYEKEPETAAALFNKLERQHRLHVKNKIEIEKADLDNATIRELKSLGYLK
jgi:arylsulfatase A-like enzyme